MRYGELFAGIGGFGLAAQHLGWTEVWASEIDEHAQAVYRRRFPGARLVGDVTKWDPDPALDAVDLITAGFPCQDLSVAGKRKGLKGGRSGLFWEIVRVARRLRPSWLLVENVPGLLSSPPGAPGRDLEIVLAALDELGYGVAWAGLDAQYFGVAQRRERVLLVGRLGAPCPPEVLFEPEGLRGDPPARRAAGEGAPAPARGGAAGEGELTGTVGTSGKPDRGETTRAIVTGGRGKAYPGTSQQDADMLVVNHPDIVGTIGSGIAKRTGTTQDTSIVTDVFGREIADPLLHTASQGLGHNRDGMAVMAFEDEPAPPAVVAFKPGHYTRGKDGAPAEITPPLTADADKGDQEAVVLDERQLEIPLAFAVRTAQTGANGEGVAAERSHALDGARGQAVITFKERGRAEGERLEVREDGVANALTTPNGGRGGTGAGDGVVAFQLVGDRDDPSVSVGDVAPTLPADPMSDRVTGVLAFDGLNQQAAEELHHPLRVGQDSGDGVLAFDWQHPHGSEPNADSSQALGTSRVPAVGFSQNQRGELVEHEAAHQLTTGGGKPGEGYAAAMVVGVPRRLTPRECERLQAFPDDWTAVGLRADGREYHLKDGARYRCLGNAVCVNVVEWVMRRIAAAHEEAR